MPIYEYQCQQCSGKFEVLTSFAEREQAQPCPGCQSTKTRVLVSSFAAVGFDDAGAETMASGGGCACGGHCGCGAN